MTFLPDLLQSPEALFDRLGDTVFFVKDAACRYVLVNDTLVNRLGRKHKAELIGKSADALFPASLANRIMAQDRTVLRTGVAIQGELELHLYPDGHQDWCLTWKEPLRNHAGHIIGLSGISRDLRLMPNQQPDLAAMAAALDHVRQHLDQPLPLAEVASLAGLSTYQLDQRIRALFGLSAGQYIARARIELACHLLRQSKSAIAQVALDCGHADQAAFTRQFKKYVGLTPMAYREQRYPSRKA